MATVPRKVSGNDFDYRDANVPFALENAVYTSGDDTLTVSVGAGRARWGDTTFELAAATTDYSVTGPIATTYYVYVDHATQSVEVSIVAPGPGDVPIGTVTFDGTSVTGTTDTRGFTPASTGALVQGGSSGRPAFSFDSDSDTGMFLGGTNELGMAVGGARVATFDALGLRIPGEFEASSVVVDSLTLDGNDLSSAGALALRAAGDVDLYANGVLQGQYDDSLGAWRLYTDGNEAVRIGGEHLRMVGGGQIRAEDGTSGAPGFAFDGDTDTGMYRDANGSLAFVHNGVVLARAGNDAFVFETADVQAQSSYTFESDEDTGVFLRGDGQVTIGSNGETVFFTDVVGNEKRLYLGGETNDWIMYNPTEEYYYFYIGDAPVGGFDSAGPFTGGNRLLGMGNAGSVANGDYLQYDDTDNHYYFYADAATSNSNLHAGGFTNTSDEAVKRNPTRMRSVREQVRANVHPIEWDLATAPEGKERRRVSAGTAQEWRRAMGDHWPGVGEGPEGLTLSLPAVDAALLAYCHDLSDALDELAAKVDALQQG